ncbi:thioredoxin family protein [Sulfitobacter sp. S190]|uniref:DUF1223 domain-containing protein n=1 Tax=Sulfitobacter sp. S190 TaxID=2867022 RepID=UPI0021A48678|nr:DUF1223 domain-containing protein [Sulfitobacter sp. S190]UWR21315.1 DUF1223 domain-containing protein [Sulfitobacter sp. S190]
MSRLSYPIAACAFAASTLLAGALAAEQRPVVVELYTSQGCSSCPPADEIFSELSSNDDVIAIALHVDYWDYIGWKDEFGDPAHAERQRAYANVAGRRSIYTPEMVVNGETDIVGSKPMALAKAINDHAQKAPQVDLDLTRAGDTLRIEAQPLAEDLGPMDVHVLRVIPSAETEITRGENRGHTITYTNIAHGWQQAGTWDGAGPLELSAEIAGDDPAVVLVQAQGAGPIIAAARID